MELCEVLTGWEQKNKYQVHKIQNLIQTDPLTVLIIIENYLLLQSQISTGSPIFKCKSILHHIYYFQI